MFTGNENHFITEASFYAYLERYQALPEKMAANQGGFISKESLQALLKQPEALGIRYYYGLTSSGELGLVWVAATKRGEDITSAGNVRAATLQPITPDMRLSAEGAHDISLEEAIEFSARYQERIDADTPKAGFFGKSAVQQLLNQDNCIGMNFYFGLDESGKRVMCLIGVDQNKHEITGMWHERGLLCPPWCGLDSPLANAVVNLKAISQK